MSPGEPVLRKATSLEAKKWGKLVFDNLPKSPNMEVSKDQLTVAWTKQANVSWVPCPTLAKLHSGKFSMEFHIENAHKGQIGVGFLLDWTIGPDWGFFGYLGSSSSAFSYDPTSGDIVTATESIQGGLPILEKGSGVVSLELVLPRDKVGLATFIVNNTRTPSIELPKSSVVIPAACLLSRGQKVSIRNVVEAEL